MGAMDIFGDIGEWVTYYAEVQVLNRIVGGVPKEKDTIKAWLKARMEMTDADLAELTEQTYELMRVSSGGVEPTKDAVAEEVARLYESGNGFKMVDGKLVYEGRCMKAALTEAANIVYPGVKFPGKEKLSENFRKGLKAAMKERVFVREEYITLGPPELAENEQRIKHVTGAQGRRSAITVVDTVARPLLRFHVDVLDTTGQGEGFIPREVWGMIWGAVEHNGIGADRARGDGVCELKVWELANNPGVPLAASQPAMDAARAGTSAGLEVGVPVGFETLV